MSGADIPFWVLLSHSLIESGLISSGFATAGEAVAILGGPIVAIIVALAGIGIGIGLIVKYVQDNKLLEWQRKNRKDFKLDSNQMKYLDSLIKKEYDRFPESYIEKLFNNTKEWWLKLAILRYINNTNREDIYKKKYLQMGLGLGFPNPKDVLFNPIETKGKIGTIQDLAREGLIHEDDGYHKHDYGSIGGGNVPTGFYTFPWDRISNDPRLKPLNPKLGIEEGPSNLNSGFEYEAKKNPKIENYNYWDQNSEWGLNIKPGDNILLGSNPGDFLGGPNYKNPRITQGYDSYSDKGDSIIKVGGGVNLPRYFFNVRPIDRFGKVIKNYNKQRRISKSHGYLVKSF